MKISLFGKLLFSFWLTLGIINAGLWLVYASQRTPERRVLVRAAEPLLLLLTDKLEAVGPDAAEKDLLKLPLQFRNQITIEPEKASWPRVESSSNQMVSHAVAPDGRAYNLILHYQTNFDPGPFKIPMKVLITEAVAGVLFSAALYFYLTRPLTLLRRGFERLSQGDLEVKLYEKVGRRRDEIIDLARDFDVMADRINQLVSARDRLLHDVSHELRSPLTRVQLAIGLARQNPQRIEDSLNRIEREAQRLDLMVRELLALARIESGIDELNDYFDPISVIENLIQDARFEAEMKGEFIELKIPAMDEDCRPSIRGSADLFRRAIENVVRNALRFSPAGSTTKIEVTLLQDPLRYSVIITDEGPGVEPGMINKIFDPFMRGDTNGVGLGLSISKRAILAHGGTVTAMNNVEKGFSVAVEVPAMRHDPDKL